MKTPLDGIRVIDWTIWQQGPFATALLGDLGAEVIKLETLDGGQARCADAARRVGRQARVARRAARRIEKIEQVVQHRSRVY